eukprot:scaffold18122_cov194-Amphora_coffeaeformis.AAC.2
MIVVIFFVWTLAMCGVTILPPRVNVHTMPRLAVPWELYPRLGSTLRLPPPRANRQRQLTRSGRHNAGLYTAWAREIAYE